MAVEQAETAAKTAVPAPATAQADGCLTDSASALQAPVGNCAFTRRIAAAGRGGALPPLPRTEPPPLARQADLQVELGLAQAVRRRAARSGERCACGGTIGADGLCDRCRAPRDAGGGVLLRQSARPADSRLPESPFELSAVPDFAIYSEADRLAAVDRILDQWWVGPVDEGTLERIWRSFGNQLTRVASEHMDLFRRSAERGAELLDLPQLATLRSRFRQDVIGLARQHLVDNRAYVTAQLQRLGLSESGAEGDAGGRQDELAAIQRDAGNVSRAQEAQRRLRGLIVGTEYRDDHPGIGDSLTPVPVSFNPERRPQFGPTGREDPPLASWDQAKLQYDRLAALIAGIANQNPAIFAAIRDNEASSLAGANPEDALRLVRTGLTGVLRDIDSTRPKLSGELDYRDLTPIHDQLFAGARGISGEDWSTGMAQWVGRDVLRDHEATEFWITLGLGTLAAAAFVVAELATFGSATFFIAAGIGAGIGIGQAAHSWDRYLTLAEAARTNVRDDLALLGGGQASAALVQAVLDSVFAFLDVYAVAGRAVRATGQAGRVATREAAERAEREIAELAQREAAEQAEQRAAATAGRAAAETGEGVLHEAPVAIGASEHTLKIVRTGDRVRLWLCTDCALLIDKVGDAITALPAGSAHDTLRTQLGEIRAAAQRFEAQFQGTAAPPIGAPRLNYETNQLASRLAALSRTHPDIEALIFFRTFMADAAGAERILGPALTARLRAELGEEGLVTLMRDVGPEGLRGLSDLPGRQITDLLNTVRAACGDDTARVMRWLGEGGSGAEARALLAEVSPETIRSLVMVSARNRISAAELRQLVDRLGGQTIEQLRAALGRGFNGPRLQELARFEMIALDPALQRLVDSGRGQVARSLGALRGRTVAEIEGELVRAGMRGPRAERGMRIWTHQDGSVVRIKARAQALGGMQNRPHIVREISRRRHAYETRDIIAKLTEDGGIVPAGTEFARDALRNWFRTVTGGLPTPADEVLLMDIWGRAGHVPVTL